MTNSLKTQRVYSVFDNSCLLVQATDTPTREPGGVHKVDNGLVFSDGVGGFYDCCFGCVPASLRPSFKQSTLGWLTSLHTEGILDSNLVLPSSGSVLGAAYLKTLVYNKHISEYRVEYKRACECLKHTVKPWALLSDQPSENFELFDSVKLYSDMSERGFMPGKYKYSYLKHCTPDGSLTRSETRSATRTGKTGGKIFELHESVGWFCCVLLKQEWVNPTYYDNSPTIKFNILIREDDEVELFDPASWIAQAENPEGEEKRPPSFPEGEDAKLQSGATWTVRERTLK